MFLGFRLSYILKAGFEPRSSEQKGCTLTSGPSQTELYQVDICCRKLGLSLDAPPKLFPTTTRCLSLNFQYTPQQQKAILIAIGQTRVTYFVDALFFICLGGCGLEPICFGEKKELQNGFPVCSVTKFQQSLGDFGLVFGKLLYPLWQIYATGHIFNDSNIKRLKIIQPSGHTARMEPKMFRISFFRSSLHFLCFVLSFCKRPVSVMTVFIIF